MGTPEAPGQDLQGGRKRARTVWLEHMMLHGHRWSRRSSAPARREGSVAAAVLRADPGPTPILKLMTEPVDTPDPGADSDIDRRRLREILARFRAHNQLRAQRLLEGLPTHHRRIVEVLPILYHQNHPALPGYVKSHTPRGLPGFQPGLNQIRAARQIALSYTHERLVEVRPQLQALFAMGSAGSIGHSPHSDLDLWVCCDARLHRELAPKVQQIQQWARREQLDLQTFLVDPRQLIDGTLTTSDTPVLLLDEFYRSAIHLAGSYPAWWLVPVSDNHGHEAYVERLVEQRHVARNELVDFGTITHYPRREVFLGALRELRNALTTPFKSLLKFMLIRTYAEAPEAPGLALSYKHLLQTGEQSPEDVDTYLLLYQHLEQHWKEGGEPQRIELARTLLLRKIARGNPALARNPAGLRLLGQWGIEDQERRRLQDPSSWSMAALLAETRLVNAELRNALAYLESLEEELLTSKVVLAAPSNELAALREQLRETCDDDRIHPTLLPEKLRAMLRLRPVEDGWQLLEAKEVLLTVCSLTGVALWAVRNGLERHNFVGPASERLGALLTVLRTSPVGYRAFVNVAPPLAGASASDSVLTAWNDPLNYSGRTFNLIRDLEVQCGTEVRRFQGSGELPDAIRFMACQPQSFECHCLEAPYRARIEARLAGLVAHLNQALREQPNSHHVFSVAGVVHCLCPEAPDSLPLGDPEALVPHLDVTAAAAVTIDPTSNALKPYQLLARACHQQPVITIRVRIDAAAIVLIRNGRWRAYRAPPRPYAELASSLAVFLGHYQQRHAAEKLGIYTEQDGQVLRMNLKTVHDSARFRVTLTQGETGFEIVCGPDQWLTATLTRDTLDRVIDNILSHRAASDLYPIYLTDARVLATDDLGELLNFKFRFESALWRRMRSR